MSDRDISTQTEMDTDLSEFSPVDEDKVLDLLTTCSLNNISERATNKADNINNNKDINNEDNVFDYSSEDEVEYGDEDTILSMTTSRRSLFDPSNPHKSCCLSDVDADSLLFDTDTSRDTVIPLLPTNPPPMDEKYWCEPDGSTFVVRSKSYVNDRKKVASGPSLFRLFAVDMVKVEGSGDKYGSSSSGSSNGGSSSSSSSAKPILSGVCAHPNERVQKALQAQKNGEPGSELPPFIFCINIFVPGKPAFHAAFYYAVDDKSLIDPAALDPESDVTSPNPEFTKLASKFFFGKSDQFRDKTFKLIPRIAKGNFVVKKAVGSKPTLLGTKLKQHYVMNERFFELIIDVGSDKIAKKVVGLSRGYAETLVVDMAFVLEGKSASTLPEQVLGSIRLSNLDFNANYRSLKDPNRP
mmetsp:Transcript_18847/g.23742  ORF Transcript_18847/g.23742 Transcript_18847/m.23742 type:complete len:411 (+) Transcript_18847:251-1483(+)